MLKATKWYMSDARAVNRRSGVNWQGAKLTDSRRNGAGDFWKDPPTPPFDGIWGY